MIDLSYPFDARTTLARPDLAAQALEGLVRAEAFRPLEPMRGVEGVADIHATASPDSERIDQLLHGEVFDVLERRGSRVWGQARRDGIVGWMDAGAVAPFRRLPDRRVRTTRSDLPLNAFIDADAPPSEDYAPIGAFETDVVAVAERLVGVPHSPGARSSVATDCSGLVQQALLACGLAGPRLAHEQAGLGCPVDRVSALRGDIVVWLEQTGDHRWTGHSALMRDDRNVIHATGYHGAVVVEALTGADDRCRADGLAPAVFRRLV